MKSDSQAGQGASRRTSLRALFVLGHVPMAAFAIGLVPCTLFVLGYVDDEVGRVTGLVGPGGVAGGEIAELGAHFKTVWLACLAGFFVMAGIGSSLVAWSHRVLSQRIARIIGHARSIGAGEEGVVIHPEADDSLGDLEKALGQVASMIAHRDAIRGVDLEARENLARVQRALAMIDTEADAHRVVRRALTHLLPADSAHLLMADSSQAHLREVLVVGKSPDGHCGVEAPGRCPAVQHGSPLTFLDSQAIDACPRLLDLDTARSSCCVPITVMGRTTGVLHVVRAAGADYTATEMVQLDALATALGARTGAVRMLETTQLQAGTDGLTGLLNRRSLETRATELFKCSDRVAVAMADLDYFKRLNDTHGHAAGDRTLRAFSQVMRSTLRPADLVARWGGEEFCVLLDDCSAEEARIALDRVRHRLARTNQEGEAPSCTVSFGVAQLGRDGATLEELLLVADRALYQAKQQGRDRVVVWGEAPRDGAPELVGTSGAG